MFLLDSNEIKWRTKINFFSSLLLLRETHILFSCYSSVSIISIISQGVSKSLHVCVIALLYTMSTKVDTESCSSPRKQTLCHNFLFIDCHWPWPNVICTIWCRVCSSAVVEGKIFMCNELNFSLFLTYCRFGIWCSPRLHLFDTVKLILWNIITI